MTRSVQSSFDLTGKTALITGGSRGFGRQMALALGQAGARIMLCARHPDALEAATADLQAAGIDTRWLAADCAIAADLQQLVAQTLQRMGDIDILLNCAGVSAGAAAAPDEPHTHWDRVMNLNLRGYFLLSELVARHSMMGRRRGRILHVAPVGAASLRIGLGLLACHTAQAALAGLTRALAGEWGQHNITVNAICPGFDTSQASAAQPTRQQRQHGDESLNGIALLLASDAGQSITGQWLALDADTHTRATSRSS